MNLTAIMNYPLWTLLCAIFFPAVAATATFVCLRRARTAKKMTGFFIIIPIYAVLTVIFLSDTGAIMSDLLASFGLSFPPVVGLLSAIALGILCLNITALVCGSGLLKPRGAVANSIASLIALAANIFLTYKTWVMRDYFDKELPRNDAGVIYVKDIFPALPDSLANPGIEMIVLDILAIFLVIYFLSFIALKSPEELLKEDAERIRRSAPEIKVQNTAPKRDIHTEDDIRECCACCEHATILKGDRAHMVCDSFGVVSASHTCRKFLYDPLKRTACRPKSDPRKSGESHVEFEHI